VDSGPLPGTGATCSFGADVFAGGALAAGAGARSRVSVYNTAGGTRFFYLSLPDGYSGGGRSSSSGSSAQPQAQQQQNASRADDAAAAAAQLSALPLLIALHGGAAYGDGFLTGAHAPRDPYRAPAHAVHCTNRRRDR
jgi:hypothetical protein